MLAALLSGAPALAQRPNPAAIAAVDSISITVSDADRSTDFFTRVLSFEKLSDTEVAGAAYEQMQGLFGLRMRVVRLRLGDEDIELVEYLAPEGRPLPLDSRSNDFWFQHIAIVVGDMDEAYRQLRAQRVRHVSSGPQTLPEWNKNAGGIRAFYFKDPDGHTLELIQFPPGKGAAKWQVASPRLFRGIDHTAMVVADTETSLRFYRDTLGLQVAGASENYGPEQEHLNNVFGARLRITALRAAQGPGIELLEYLAPGDGRAVPGDLRANDLLHWQTRLVVDSVDAQAQTLRASRARFLSPGVTRLPQHELGFAAALLVRDPDGHALHFVER